MKAKGRLANCQPSFFRKNIPTGIPVGMKKVLNFLYGEGNGFAVDVPFFGKAVDGIIGKIISQYVTANESVIFKEDYLI
jgi:hypothetical protein